MKDEITSLPIASLAHARKGMCNNKKRPPVMNLFFCHPELVSGSKDSGITLRRSRNKFGVTILLFFTLR
jgi:hypothetical protein